MRKRLISVYDSEENLTQVMDKGSNGRIYSDTTYEYDMEGNITKKSSMDCRAESSLNT